MFVLNLTALASEVAYYSCKLSCGSLPRCALATRLSDCRQVANGDYLLISFAGELIKIYHVNEE